MAIKDIQLPEIGEGVTEGELIRWLVKPGDVIQEDKPLVEVMTDKATVEIPSIVRGKVKEFRAAEGDTIEVGQVILTVDLESSSAESTVETPAKSTPSPSQSASKSAPPADRGTPPSPQSTVSKELPPVDSKVLASPATRRLAREAGVDINKITGTGNVGRVTREDVLKSVSQWGAGKSTGVSSERGSVLEERVPLRGVRKKIAQKMQLSKQIIPHFTLMEEVNVSELVRLKSKLKPLAEKRGVKVTYLPFVIKALIVTAREFPMFNATIDDEASEIIYKKYFNIGIAANTPQGLMVPVIKDADQKSIWELSGQIVDLSTKAKNGQLALDEMKGATISVTNIGSVGGTYATPIINHPEVAILGMYKISQKPVFVDGHVTEAHMMNVTITADHRLIDGAVAAYFLKAFAYRLENPSILMLEDLT